VNLTGADPAEELANRFENRIVPSDDLVVTDDRDGHRYLALGFDVIPVYEKIAEKEIGPSDEKTRAVTFTAAEEVWVPYTAFSFGTFGSLPDRDIDYRRAFVELLKARDLQLAPAQDLSSTREAYSPLDATSYRIRLMGGSSGLSSHVVYLGDPASLMDLTEFWNVRAAGHRVVFLPKDHPETHLDVVHAFVEQGSYQVNANYRNRAVLMQGHGVTSDECECALEQINAGRDESIARTSIPRWGVQIEGYVGDIRVAQLEAASGEEIALLDGRRLTPVKLLAPNMLDEADQNRYRQYRWCVDLTFSGSSFDNEWCFHFPRTRGVEKLVARAFMGVMDEVRLSRGGVTMMHSTPREMLLGIPVRTDEVFQALFSDAGLEAELSQPGRFAQRIISKMGLLHFDCRIFKIRGVRDVLGRLSNGSILTKGNMRQIIMSEESNGYGVNWRPDLYDGLIVKRGVTRLPNFTAIFDVLLERRAIRPGLTFRCPNCFAESWYHVSEFDEEYSCRFCFERQRVGFGSANEWQYKADGLFQIQDSAMGSLAVIVALWRLAESSQSNDTNYSTSLNLRDKDNGQAQEVDFAFLSHDRWIRSRDEFVIGEARGFNPFEATDVSKLKGVADRFAEPPLMAFATLKDSFAADEKELLNQLVRDGYRLIPLTREELDPYGLHDRLAGRGHRYPFTLAELGKACREANLVPSR
jgi:hypothetical protein